MKHRCFYVLLALVMLALAGMACASAAAPEQAEPTKGPQVTESALETSTPVVPPSTLEPTPEIEERLVEMEWPAVMRVGDNDVLRLSLIPAPGGGYVPTPEIGGHEVGATPIPVTVTRPGYTGYARATLSASGLDAELASPEEQLLVSGRPNVWRWTISPGEAGTYRVILSLSVRWVPEEDSDLPGPFEEALWERILTVEARSTFGLSGIQTDLLGAGGSVLGLVTGVPFAEKGLEMLLKRFKQWREGPQKAKKA